MSEQAGNSGMLTYSPPLPPLHTRLAKMFLWLACGAGVLYCCWDIYNIIQFVKLVQGLHRLGYDWNATMQYTISGVPQNMTLRSVLNTMILLAAVHCLAPTAYLLGALKFRNRFFVISATIAALLQFLATGGDIFFGSGAYYAGDFDRVKKLPWDYVVTFGFHVVCFLLTIPLLITLPRYWKRRV